MTDEGRKQGVLTDNEKLQLWQLGAVFNNIPDYLNNDTAAMSLLDTLVEKGYWPELYYGTDDHDSEYTVANTDRWFCQAGLTLGYHIKPTRREAVVAACLEMIGKEDV